MPDNRFSHLFEPIMIGCIEIPNRIAMAPMGIGTLCTDEGGFSNRAIDYYVERAKGGTGLIVAGFFKIEDEIEKLGSKHPPYIGRNRNHFIATAYEMNEKIHAYGSKIFLQIGAGFGRSLNPALSLPQFEPIAPSAIPNYWVPTTTCREMTTQEVEAMVRAYGDAAVLAAEAGFDGVDIHAVHEGYLLDQFTIALFNRRTDKYGGDLKERLTFPVEVVREIKQKAGQRFPVMLRYSVKSYIKDWGQGGLPGESFKEMGRDVEEGLEAARILEEAGYDAFNADTGTYDAWYWAHPPLYQKHGCNIDVVKQLKQVIKVPVLIAGRMDMPELAEQTIREKEADMVSIGRGLLADPYWPKKVMTEKLSAIRPCIGCHDGCFQRMLTKGPLSCTVNPACGREAEYKLVPATEVKEIMIVGGGIAGMEAARVAALRNHRVTIYEQSEKLGGHMIAASTPDFKEDDLRLLDWYKNELAKLNVNIVMNTEVTAAMILEKQTQPVIIATGSKPVIPNIPGIDKGHACTAVDLLLGNKEAGDTVIIVGGGLIGCETALWLSQQGKKVTIVEMLDDILSGGLSINHANRKMLIDLLNFHGTEILTGQSLLEITNNGATIIDSCFKQTQYKADTVAIAIGLSADNRLYRQVQGKIPDLYLIGDARQSRKIMDAVWDAYEVARTI